MSKPPRLDSTTVEIVDAFSVLMHVLGPTGRATIREHLLRMSDSDDARVCLRVMNDVERIIDWRAKNPEPTP